MLKVVTLWIAAATFTFLALPAEAYRSGSTPIVAPVLTTITMTPNTGVVSSGGTVALVLGFSESVVVSGGTPTLTLNSGGTGTYTSGSGTASLSFSYTAAFPDATSSLAVTAVNLNGATIQNSGVNAVLSLTGITQVGPSVVTGSSSCPVASPGVADGCNVSGNDPAAAVSSGSNVLTVSGSQTGLFDVGMLVTGANIPAYDYITQRGTGTGGAGTYQMTINATGTSGSESVTASAVAPTTATISTGCGSLGAIATLGSITGGSGGTPGTYNFVPSISVQKPDLAHRES